ncbi:class I SAM-dependent methyltransferase [Sneathiella limimaris]|uniref:class I SAM-dependent methyltransferase n=1 Tax=Sneathiella limimaris TaxID=1964213 RepID=UPI00146ABDE8|nr:class I SAM-dependent methyltransferase [Sneathiella limimaris]
MSINIPPIFIAALLQILSFGILFTVLPLLQQSFGFAIPLFAKLTLQGVLAGVGSLCLRQSYWWVVIQLLFPFCIFAGLQYQIPLWVYPIILLLLALVFWNVVINRVPLYLTNQSTTNQIAKLLPKKGEIKFADLGSGLASTLRGVASQRADVKCVGYETAPIPFILSWLLVRINRQQNVSLKMQSLWSADLAQYDVVYCFLSPVPMERLFEKAKSEMKPGSLFISNSFSVPGQKPTRTVRIKDGRQTKLLIWKM